MSDPFLNRLNDELSRRKKENLFRQLNVSGGGRINLSGNDYFQLRSHPAVVAGAKEAMEKYGTGSGASPLLYGYFPCHAQLLDRLLEWKKKSAGMLFNTGFMANQAVLKHLPGKNDLVLADRLIHHSMAQALGETRFNRYQHLDLAHLEELLHKHHKDYETVFVVTESVFSMDGDYPDLKALVDLKLKYPFILVLDEAHGTGVFGNTGAGLAEEMGVSDQVDILVGTLGKSLASMGAYVLTRSSTITDYLVNVAGEFIYSTFLPPSQAGAAEAAIDILQDYNKERVDLRKRSVWLRQEIAGLGWPETWGDSPIIPVVTGDTGLCLALRDRFMEKGVLIGAVRPPTVPQGTSRLRLSLHSNVTESQFSEILELLKK